MFESLPQFLVPEEDLPRLARALRRAIITMSYQSKSAHIGSALCLADILAVLFGRLMQVRPKEPEWPERDRFILSKGHGAAALYAALAWRGFFPAADLLTYCQDGGKLHGHPCRHAAPGIETSTGSLGHGLGVAAGMALGLRGRSPGRIYVLVGDGECNEGAIWEAAMFIASHRLTSITVIIDDNKWQGFGKTSAVQQMDLAAMWTAFGWSVARVDGHNPRALEAALRAAPGSNQPVAIIADTIAGKGIKAVENTLLAHYIVLDEANYRQAMDDLKD
ncbi:MAG: transketolase [Candidatus Magasanikbacteria bacterium]|nr:transketolase [Candidatus Magasanikbacteria bacterium]